MNIDNFTKGWVVGDFSPSLINNKDLEVGLKHYKAGDRDEKHYHKIATEYTVVSYGVIKMMSNLYTKGDIVKINPLEINEFECIEDACVLVIKTPSVIGDKYII